ncbi:MAG: hypothetical protein FRX49_07738 [Trebouxia sp. A1-2]|nr:MAG: hypothetical protein FRX49_07738 [Trebouxia sp. A1-2]
MLLLLGIWIARIVQHCCIGVQPATNPTLLEGARRWGSASVLKKKAMLLHSLPAAGAKKTDCTPLVKKAADYTLLLKKRLDLGRQQHWGSRNWQMQGIWPSGVAWRGRGRLAISAMVARLKLGILPPLAATSSLNASPSIYTPQEAVDAAPVKVTDPKGFLGQKVSSISWDDPTLMLAPVGDTA